MTELHFLFFICPMVFLASLVDSVAGGGGLISLPAYMVGLPPHVALACNKFSSTCGTTVSCVRFMKRKMVEIRTAAISVVFALAGSYVGAKTVLLVDASFVKYLVLVVIPIVAVLVLRKKDFGLQNNFQSIPRVKAVLCAGCIGLGIGFYDGFFGPGTGTFLMIAYTAALRFDLVTASGNTKLVNLSSNIGALTVFLLNGQVDFRIAIPAALCSIAGNFVGSGLAMKKGAKIIKPMFAVVLSLLIVYTVSK